MARATSAVAAVNMVAPDAAMPMRVQRMAKNRIVAPALIVPDAGRMARKKATRINLMRLQETPQASVAGPVGRMLAAATVRKGDGRSAMLRNRVLRPRLSLLMEPRKPRNLTGHDLKAAGEDAMQMPPAIRQVVLQPTASSNDA